MDRLLWYPTYFLRPIDIWFSMVSDSDSYCSFSSKISSNLIKPSGFFLNLAWGSTAMRKPVKYMRNIKTVNCDLLVSRFHQISTKGLVWFIMLISFQYRSSEYVAWFRMIKACFSLFKLYMIFHCMATLGYRGFCGNSSYRPAGLLCPLLLTWINFNPSMDK